MEVKLVKMNDSEFSDYLREAIPAYARTNIEAGRWSSLEANGISEAVHKQLLPNGKETEDNYLLKILAADRESVIGDLWVMLENNSGTISAYICDIVVYEPYRNKGYGKAALNELENFVSKLGASKIGLNVFNHNSVAVSLYNSLGYQVSNQFMLKSIDQ